MKSFICLLSSHNAKNISCQFRACNSALFCFNVAVFAAYINIFDNAFLYDDNQLIQVNEYLHSRGHIGDILTRSTLSGAHWQGGGYRPLQMLLYLLIFHLGGGATFLFHLLMPLHLVNTCLVYRLGTKLGFKPWGVFLGTLVWGLHPLHTEAVTYMSGTADPLFSFFCLWAIIILLPDISSRKILKIIPLFLLGLLSKETTVIFPIIVMGCLFLVHPKQLNIRTYFRIWPLWIIALIYAVWRLNADGFYGSLTIAHALALPDFATAKIYADHPLYRIYTFWPLCLLIFVCSFGLKAFIWTARFPSWILCGANRL